MNNQNYSEVEYFSKGVSLGKNCLQERTRTDFRKQICNLTVRDPELRKTIDRVVFYHDGKIRLDTDDATNPGFKQALTELFEDE